MGYDTNHDPYIDNKSGVLINKFNATDPKILEEIETTITSSILANLDSTIDFKPSTDIFLSIHKELFIDIYSWAGKPREIDIGKGSSYFAHAPYITVSLDELFKEIITDNRLHSKSKSIFVEALAHYYSELNAIHPFREGNGRTIRAFLTLFAKYYGWSVDWTNLDRDSNIDASIAAISGDESFFVNLLNPLVDSSSQD